MRSDAATAARAAVGLAFLLGGPALAQDASLDRANSRRRRAGLSLKTSCLQIHRHSRGAPQCARVIRLEPQRLQRPPARVTLRRIGKPSTSPPAARPSAAE